MRPFLLLRCALLSIPASAEAQAPVVNDDTFTDSRAFGRPHDAIDIIAPSGTPVHPILR